MCVYVHLSESELIHVFAIWGRLWLMEFQSAIKKNNILSFVIYRDMDGPGDHIKKVRLK